MRLLSLKCSCGSRPTRRGSDVKGKERKTGMRLVYALGGMGKSENYGSRERTRTTTKSDEGARWIEAVSPDRGSVRQPWGGRAQPAGCRQGGGPQHACSPVWARGDAGERNWGGEKAPCWRREQGRGVEQNRGMRLSGVRRRQGKVPQTWDRNEQRNTRDGGDGLRHLWGGYAIRGGWCGQ